MRTEDPKHPCVECWLRYSSYCIGCSNEPFGIGLLPVPKKEGRSQ